MKKWPPLRCRLPCGCWVEWVCAAGGSRVQYWKYVTAAEHEHYGPRITLYSPNYPSETRYLVAAVVASGYGLAARAKIAKTPPRKSERSQRWRDLWPHKRKHERKHAHR